MTPSTTLTLLLEKKNSLKGKAGVLSLLKNLSDAVLHNVLI